MIVKRRIIDNKLNDSEPFMSNVVIKKSKLQLEKEAAMRVQMEQKENELKKVSLSGKAGGIVIKFDQFNGKLSPKNLKE